MYIKETFAVKGTVTCVSILQSQYNIITFFRFMFL